MHTRCRGSKPVRRRAHQRQAGTCSSTAPFFCTVPISRAPHGKAGWHGSFAAGAGAGGGVKIAALPPSAIVGGADASGSGNPLPVGSPAKPGAAAPNPATVAASPSLIRLPIAIRAF